MFPCGVVSALQALGSGKIVSGGFTTGRDCADTSCLKNFVHKSASSMLFELAEWAGAVLLAPEFADSYLGQQGDLWDAHKDMALATAGSVLSVFVSVIVWNFRSRKPIPA